MLLTTTLSPLLQASVLSKSSQLFGNDLFRAVSGEKSQSTLAISPFAIYSSLLMIISGAEAETFATLLKILKLDDFKSFENEYFRLRKDIRLPLFSKIFVSRDISIKKLYVELLQRTYLSEIEAVDFLGGQGKINDWIRDKTHTIIQRFQPLPLDTKILIANCLNFKGVWLKSFNKNWTKSLPFFMQERTSLTETMTIVDDLNYFMDKNVGATVIELPYKDDHLVFLLFIPGDNHEIEEVSSSLHLFDFSNYHKFMYRRRIKLTIPKFKIITEIDLREHLKYLGLSFLFSPRAELGKMVDKGFLGQVRHKMVFEVDEEGVEEPDEDVTFSFPFEVNCNRPFLFALVFKNDTSYVMSFGIVGNLTETFLTKKGFSKGTHIFNKASAVKKHMIIISMVSLCIMKL